MANDKIHQQAPETLARTAYISTEIRNALRNALPAPAEQFFTVMVPGKVINFADYYDASSFDEDGKLVTPLLPREVRLNEAILCDDMPALGGVQLGPTGRSVARSYSTALSKLTPAVTTFGTNVTLDDGSEPKYLPAMAWLLEEDPEHPGKTRLDVYVEKQTGYTDAVERKTKAFDNALDAATSNPTLKTLGQKRAAYDKWVSENRRTYRNNVQAAYMDWVVTGKKIETDYWFAVVDNDSAMSRVEASKESMRAANVSDTDGAVEYNTVRLTPDNWAWLAKQKATRDAHGDGKTVEWYTFEIGRLEKMNLMLKALGKTITKADPNHPTPTSTPPTPSDAEIDTAATGLLTAQTAFHKLGKDAKPEDKKKAESTLVTARKTLSDAFAKRDKDNITNLNAEAQQTQQASIDGFKFGDKITANNKTITEYKAARKKLLESRLDVQTTIAREAGIAGGTASSSSADKPLSQPSNAPNYWTSISVEVKSSYAMTKEDQSSKSYAVGASGGYGGFTASGSYAHSEASANAEKQMAESSVKVSFDCMRVDIGRGWLRPELFYDNDLKPAHGTKISPGPVKLGWLMDPDSYVTPKDSTGKALYEEKDRQKVLTEYNLFPMYPTAFLLAANVVLDIEGETADIQTHFHTASTSASFSAGYGPFSVTGSYASSDTESSSSCETTANGCRITIKAPQIIGWISQMVPAMPRIAATMQ